MEFGLKRGLGAPTALNNGQQVELLLTRITAPYHLIDRFDELPTPFSAVAVDLAHASQVVLNRGSLAQAMRATMSLPLIFPPVEIEGRLLVDGGAMNNVPADVVRAMGADRVIAVNVGELEDPDEIDVTMLGVAGATIDAMMRNSTRKVIAGADVVIDVPLKEFGSLDWRRSAELIDEGYRAADAMRDRLLPMALDESAYAEWKAERQRRRRTTIPAPAFVTTRRLRRRRQPPPDRHAVAACRLAARHPEPRAGPCRAVRARSLRDHLLALRRRTMRAAAGWRSAAGQSHTRLHS